MNGIQFLNRLMLLVSAPFLGVLIAIIIITSHQETTIEPIARVQYSTDAQSYETTVQALSQSKELAKIANTNIESSYSTYHETTTLVGSLLPVINKTLEYPYAIYDKKISSKLGTPSSTINGSKMRAQLYYKSYDNFKGYAVKIKLKSNAAVKMVLGGDEAGESMTTLQAAKKHGAAVAINAGGFADSGSKRYPLGTTIIDGEYVDGFHPSKNDLFFAGFNSKNELIGGKFTSKDQLDKLKPRFGASFVPILLQNGKKQSIPKKWQSSPSRAPRVVLANYKDDQILLFVTDGYKTNGSAGATLAELQSILQNLGVQSAYNMDGGGSASLIFNGNVINNPSDGQLRKLPTHLLFFK